MFVPSTQGGQKRVPELLELELQLAVTSLWVIRTKPVSSIKSSTVVNHQTISPAPQTLNGPECLSVTPHWRQVVDKCPPRTAPSRLESPQPLPMTSFVRLFCSYTELCKC